MKKLTINSKDELDFAIAKHVKKRQLHEKDCTNDKFELCRDISFGLFATCRSCRKDSQISSYSSNLDTAFRLAVDVGLDRIIIGTKNRPHGAGRDYFLKWHKEIAVAICLACLYVEGYEANGLQTRLDMSCGSCDAKQPNFSINDTGKAWCNECGAEVVT